jgi:outer membrane protein OmpA-like peptidoglycan-associated protein
VANKGCPADKDGDSIPDDKDQCPEVAGVAKYHGCPVPDTDKDGINDEEDKCPTIAGPEHNSGCPEVTREQIKKVAEVARKIQFDFNKAELTPSSKTVLNEVVQLLKENATLKIRVEGHTSGADNQKNLILSEARAQSVKAYLVENGIDEQRITAVGFGSKEPLSKGTEPNEVAKNRRVELKLY